MSNMIKEKVAVITGASAGIGYASALALGGEGASLVLVARRVERLEKLVNEVEQAGGKAVHMDGDASKGEPSEKLLTKQ